MQRTPLSLRIDLLHGYVSASFPGVDIGPVALCAQNACSDQTTKMEKAALYVGSGMMAGFGLRIKSIAAIGLIALMIFLLFDRTEQISERKEGKIRLRSGSVRRPKNA